MTKEQLNTDDLFQQLEQGYFLPAMPLVAFELMALASDEKSSASDLVKLIEVDSALTIRLLRMANSSFFWQQTPIVNLHQAVVRVGFDRLRTMALSITLRDTFPSGKANGMDYDAYWRQSLYRGLLAKSFADSLGNCHPEDAFVAGLTLEIGLLIFHELIMENTQLNFKYVDMRKLLRWEREKYGISHRDVGYAALKYWGFPYS